MTEKYPIILVLDNIRSLYNVGSIFRIADGAGISKLYLCGITGYPRVENDPRKPWEIEKVTVQIDKTALGAQNHVEWKYYSDTLSALGDLRKEGYQVAALEIAKNASDFFKTEFTMPLALVVGHETAGIPSAVLKSADLVVQLPMNGVKNSLNVATATAIAVYELVRRLS